MHSAALITGDGIGPEICEAAQRVVDAAGVSIDWRPAPMGLEAQGALGVPIPVSSLRTVRQCGVALKGPMIADRCSGGVVVEDDGEIRRHASINNGIRRELGAYANLRPVRGFPGVSGAYENLDIVIVRELTEDMYAGLETSVDDDTAEAVKRITRAASERVTRFACEYARRTGRRRVTAVHKANVLHLTDGLFLASARRVAAEYSSLEFNDQMVDAACYLLIKSFAQFEVLVMPNQYGDILSDMTAGLAGSLGLAPGVNIGPEAALFEAAHGAAPDIAGKGIANPIAMMLSGALMLEHLGEAEAAERIRNGVARVLAARERLTPDLGGASGSAALTAAICAVVRG
jgi:isocitrate dehydrogenase (NAD+)